MSLDTGMWSVAQGAGRKGQRITVLEERRLYSERLNLSLSA